MNVVLSDIDGVLQPLDSQRRFEHDMDALRRELVALRGPGYAELSKFDIGAVRYDWHPKAVENLRTFCTEGQASIVLTSRWREGKTLGALRLLLEIQGLGSLLQDMTPLLGTVLRDDFRLGGGRHLEIKAYLEAHPEVERYVIVDDVDDGLSSAFPSNFVQTEKYLDRRALREMRRIFECQATA